MNDVAKDTQKEARAAQRAAVRAVKKEFRKQTGQRIGTKDAKQVLEMRERVEALARTRSAAIDRAVNEAVARALTPQSQSGPASVVNAPVGPRSPMMGTNANSNSDRPPVDELRVIACVDDGEGSYVQAPVIIRGHLDESV